MQKNSSANDPRARTMPPEHSRFAKSEIHQSIPDRFEYMVKMHAERNAVSDCGDTFSYKRLNEKSNQIAHLILEARGTSEEPVSFLLDQGTASIIAILGILKAGKFYVALDPFLSRSMLGQAIADCQPTLLVTNNKYMSMASDLAPPGAICINLQEISANTSKCNPAVALESTRLAYIFYTSGSTGAPKGVADCHRNVLHNVMRYTNNLGITFSDRLSLIQSCSFSGTVSSIFSAVLNGAAICPFDLHTQGVGRLADWVGREQITIFHSVPMIFEQLMARRGNFGRLRLIRLEGDQAHRRHIEMFQQRFKNACLLVNGLGTTETGILRQYCIDGESPFSGDTVPVGYAVEDMHIQLLDDTRKPVATGKIGEITVRSRYLAEGYWDRKELTEASFRPDPRDAKSRVYTTGDLGRFLRDGCLEYLGRKDSRIKVRGQTVEVARIENALCELKSIDQATVVSYENGRGYQQLVAYLVAAESNVPTVSALRRDLAKSIPEVMLPVRYVFLDELPVDRHNKVERRSLPDLNRDRPSLDEDYVAPRSPRQQALADCFGEILCIDNVGIDDDFFELGGDSLMATELLLLIERTLGMRCPTEFLFRESSVAALDRIIEIGGRYKIAVPLNPTGTRAPLFCLHNHAGYVLEYRRLAQLLGTERPVYGIQSVSGESHADYSLEKMAARYVGEIQRVQPSGPYFLCGNCFGGIVAFEVAQVLRQRDEEVALLALIDTAFPAGTMKSILRRLRLRKNFRELSQLSSRERFLSLGTKLARLFSWISSLFKRWLRFEMAKRSKNTGPPVRVTPFDVVDFHKEVEKRYRPRLYDGHIALFCVALKDNQLLWKKIGGRNLRIVQLPDQECGSDNPHLVQEPYVHTLAKELRKFL